MNKKRKIFLSFLPIIIIVGLLSWYFSGHAVPVLQPAGQISYKERQLIIVALLLSAIVVIPVYFLTIMIAIKYREGNTKAKYSPDWDHSNVLEGIWWAIPLAIITVLSVIAWNSSHSLDPYRPIDAINTPLKVQVIALDWKWLFIYPKYQVASVNQLTIPTNTPINLYITSDTVMNSLWIPSLAGQIYAMPGMSTQLHLTATKAGSYYGSSANISGSGFSGMHFQTVAVDSSGFKDWVKKAHLSNRSLSLESYNQLAKPSFNNPVSYYSSVASNLYDSVVVKYMEPSRS